MRHLHRRQLGVAHVDHVTDRLAREGLHHEQRDRCLDHLVAAHDVRVSEPADEPALLQQAARRPLAAEPVGAQRLDDATAAALVAPDVVDVEVASAAQVLDGLVAGRHHLPGGERSTHAGVGSPAWWSAHRRA
jgi:2-keto-3-deoxy-L-rhamnonate aldolase RhmA